MSKGFITGTNEELIKAYKESRDESYLKELIEANKGLINLLVSPYLTSIPNSELEDLTSESYIPMLTGLLDIEWGNGKKERFKSNGYEYHRSSGYGRTSLYLEPYTEERGRQVIQENKRKCMVGWLKEFDYTKLSYEEAEQVYTLVAGLKNS